MSLAAALAVASGQDEEEGQPFREPFYASEIEEEAGMPQALRVGGVVFVSATSAPGATLEEQMQATYIRIQSILGQYGLTMANVAQERIQTTDMDALERAASEERARAYPPGHAPASAWTEVSRLRERGALVQIEVIAVADPEA